MDMNWIGNHAKQASKQLISLTTNEKNQLLQSVATAIRNQKDRILQANNKDIAYAKEIELTPSLIERLTISDHTIDSILSGIQTVIKLEDPIGKTVSKTTRPNGLVIEQRSVPLGVIAIIYESRPNVTVDAFALTFKTGNAVILKGGKEAIHSNQILVDIIQQTLHNHNINPNAIQLFTPSSREETKELMHANQYVDVLIPRGSASLIQAVLQESTVPVIETGAGNCHIYIDKDADMKQAIEISYNAKVSRPSVCNACETILVHKDIAKEYLTKLAVSFKDQVQVYGDEIVQSYIPYANQATEEDYITEYNDYMVAIKVVTSLQEAIDHINQYSTSHSEAIVTTNKETAETFLHNVDSAAVYHNASTRFTDGFEFGFGAEIGISTQKLHVRGPMGLNALTSYKYIITGEGQIR